MATLVTCICHRCRKHFKRKIAEARRTKTHFCSRLCLSEHNQDVDSRIAYEVTSSGCWECTSHRPHDARGGYFSFRLNGKTIKMHRYMYERHKGKIPDGLLIRHKCDNPKCINPDHLEPGTHKDNVYDMIERGRQKIMLGECTSSAKLSNKQVADIKREFNDFVHQKANKYNVHYKTIWDILRGRSWVNILDAGGDT